MVNDNAERPDVLGVDVAIFRFYGCGMASGPLAGGVIGFLGEPGGGIFADIDRDKLVTGEAERPRSPEARLGLAEKLMSGALEELAVEARIKLVW
ncbi:hypothetical protein AB1484_22960 [Parafrankia sp. FMc6]|uniref:hypothetical protein n=1 Tax=Parafrankia soli TaxID=2599596 RepID=UPI0034D791F5